MMPGLFIGILTEIDFSQLFKQNQSACIGPYRGPVQAKMASKRMYRSMTWTGMYFPDFG